MLTKSDHYRKTLQAYLEYEWHEYPAYIKKMESVTLDEWIDELAETRGMSLALKRIAYIQNMVDAIDKVYNAATEDVQQLIRIRYWNKEKTNWQTLAERLGVSMQKAVRMNKALIFKTADIMGFWWDR